MSTPDGPSGIVESESLSETASKLERLREMARKYSTSEGSVKEQVSEQALESHEVVELQAFVQHRQWIEDKIKFLEGLPPIDIFAGMDELSRTHEQITTLSTRAQLDEWVLEHDNIEREAEALDAGDLKKLKAVTRAATQRNLSPEDTDLIEITLTTLSGLDKLLHLLRDRSEQLDLLGSRLTWDEQRALAHSTRTEILSNIQTFLNNRARWRLDIYHRNGVVAAEDNPTRPSEAIRDPCSRGARFKLAEEISRDVVQLSSRISSLRHGPVLNSGKVLDKLIEDSRKPVPDAMLDEQDRIEEKCEKDLTSIGKFLMAMNMQWKKANEVHIETQKDVAALEMLLTEVDGALKQLPSRREEVSFTKQIQELRTRLQARLDQTSPTALPIPKHDLFPDQVSYNSKLANVLADELNQARSLLSKVDQRINIYKAGCDLLENAEALRKEAVDLREGVVSMTRKLQTGFDAEGGEGSPPDLSQNSCVEPARFSAFLAMLPSFSDQSRTIEESTLKTIKRARLTSLRLDKPGIDDDYRQSYAKVTDELESELRSMVQARNDVFTIARRLKEVRRIWTTMNELTTKLDTILAPNLRDALLKSRWKQQIGGDSAPPTPESPTSELPQATDASELINEQISSVKESFERDVVEPFAHLRDAITASLSEFVHSKQYSIERSIFDLQSLARLLADARAQKYAMETIREEVHVLQGRIEDSKVQYDDHYEALTHTMESSSETSLTQTEAEETKINAKEDSLSRTVDTVQADVNALVDSLPTRVPLISRHTYNSPVEDASSTRIRSYTISQLPFEPSTVDRTVRNDTNTYSMRLTGGMKSLQQRRSIGAFYRAARDMSRRVILLNKDIRSFTDQLEQHARELDELLDAPPGAEVGLSALASLKASLEAMEKFELVRLRRLASTIRDDVSRMEAVFDVQEDVAARKLLRARVSIPDAVRSHLQRLWDRLKALEADAAEAEQREMAFLTEKARKEEEAAEALRRERVKQQEEEAAEALCREQAKQEEAARLELLKKETSRRLQEESAPKHEVRYSIDLLVDEDIFGPNSPSRQALDKETAELLSCVRALRKQLKSIGLNGVVRPSGASHSRSSSNSLPQPETAEAMAADFRLLEAETSKLPHSAGNTTADIELRSLRLEMDASRELVNRVQQLARMQSSVTLCDAAFSMFLDYIDSYPDRPRPGESMDMGPSKLDTSDSPQEFLSMKMAYTKGIVGDMSEHFAPVSDDPRAIAEHTRLKQTWDELMEMATEKLSGRSISRAGSASTYNSSGRNSSASVRSNNASEVKRHKYANLSVTGKDGLLAPIAPSQRRATSASSADSGSTKKGQTRLPRPSLPTQKTNSLRSVSGPMKQTAPTPATRSNMSLFNSTFASRQRTASISSNTSSTSVARSAMPPTYGRRISSTLAEGPRAPSPALSTSTRGSWSRAPRQSFGTFQRASTPERTQRRPKQKYVANPKNKLDMALGDVINNLPVDINVEAVTDTWKDKSGKYWIGGNEPKLCFCRILRSQTVMVRVGGGWVELSKFIKDHFSDLFRMLPETPPRPGSASKERWISAATLRSAEDNNSLTRSSGSPDSVGRTLPSFAISTPDGTQKSGSPRSSPLTPIQFIRRADADATEISFSSIALSNDLSTSGISISSIHPRRRMSSASSARIWKP